MKKFLPTLLSIVVVVALVFGMPGQSEALLISGSHIIPAPGSVINNPPGATNRYQEGFDEQQGIELLMDLQVDGGSITAGTIVNSHMIFLNTEGPAYASDIQTWGFDGVILGVMSNTSGTLEAASSSLLGATGTTYPAAFANRGLETTGLDGYMISGNEITVSMEVTEPGDWIRVVTAANPIPEPGTMLLLGLGLIGLAGLRRKLKK